jgi:hypothetical protein
LNILNPSFKKNKEKFHFFCSFSHRLKDEVLKYCHDVWLEPLVEALHNNLTYNGTVIYTVPIIFKYFPKCLPLIVDAICAYKKEIQPRTYFTSESEQLLTVEQLRALVGVFKTVRRLEVSDDLNFSFSANSASKIETLYQTNIKSW